MASTPPETCRKGAALFFATAHCIICNLDSELCFLFSVSPKNSCPGWNVCEVISDGKFELFFFSQRYVLVRFKSIGKFSRWL